MPDGSTLGAGPVNYESMSSTLLSRMPATDLKDLPGPAKGWSEAYIHCNQRMNSLRTWRYSFWTYCGKLAEYFSPRRWIFLPTANKNWRNQPVNDQIIDSTGLLALRICAGGLWSGLTNPNTPWFKLDSMLSWAELDAVASAWFEKTEQQMYAVLGQGNFYSIMHQAFADETLFGNAPMLTLEDHEDVCRFYLAAAGEYFLGLGPRLSHDTYAREFTWTVLQIVEMFGLDNCPSDVVKAWENDNVDQEFVVCHLIEPNYPIRSRKKNIQPVQMVASAFAYREFYWIKGNKGDCPLSVRGFNNLPFSVLKWTTISNSAYADSPCMDALGDNKQIQRETLRKAEFIEKGVRPPMGAGVQMKNEPASIQPAHITYMTSDQVGKGFWPLFEVQPAWLPALTTDIEIIQKRIEKALYVDVFMAITQMEGVEPRNELELTQRNLESLQTMGPVITNAEEALAGILQRVLDIMIRRKMVDPLPPSLQRVPMKVNFISRLRMAQRAAEAVIIKDVMGTAGALQEAAQAAGLPAPIRVINLDKAMREYADSQNFPISCIFTEDEVAANDQAHAKALQAARAPGNLMSAVEAAKSLSETGTGPGTALSAVAPAVGGALGARQ
jgi:hypothetical protein